MKKSDTPQSLASYEILERIESNEFGVVYLARTAAIPESVALWVIHQRLHRLSRFRQLLSELSPLLLGLSHPCFPRVFEVSVSSGRSFVAMEMVFGKTLPQILKDGPLREKEVLRWGVDLCTALRYVSRFCDAESGQSLRHNVGYLSQDSIRFAGDRLIYVDILPKPHGVFYGAMSPRANFASPEAYRARPLTPASDVFSLGRVLYRMSTGQPAFAGGNTFERINQVLTKKPMVPMELAPGLSEETSDLISRCVSTDPRLRPDDLEEVHLELEKRRGVALSEMPVDECLEWLRDRLYHEDFVSVERLFEVQPELLLVPVLTEYAWNHMGELLLRPWREGRPLPELYRRFLSSLPSASSALVEILREEISSEAKVEVLRCLASIKKPEVAESLAFALNEPGEVGREALKTLQILEKTLYLGMKKAKVVSCSVDWNDLEVDPTNANRRFCAQCTTHIIRLSTPQAMLDFARERCVFFDPEPLPIEETIHFRSLTEMWSLAPGETMRLGSTYRESDLCDMSLMPHHADFMQVRPGVLRAEGREGTFFFNGVEVAAATLDLRSSDRLEVGNLLFEPSDGWVRVHGNEVGGTRNTIGRGLVSVTDPFHDAWIGFDPEAWGRLYGPLMQADGLDMPAFFVDEQTAPFDEDEEEEERGVVPRELSPTVVVQDEPTLEMPAFDPEDVETEPRGLWSRIRRFWGR